MTSVYRRLIRSFRGIDHKRLPLLPSLHPYRRYSLAVVAAAVTAEIQPFRSIITATAAAAVVPQTMVTRASRPQRHVS